MMSPYEADRLFEADTARVHQFTTGVYCRTVDEPRDDFSWRRWIATRLGLARPLRKSPPVLDKEVP